MIAQCLRRGGENVTQQLPNVNRLGKETERPGFRLRQVQQIVDQPVKVTAAALDVTQVVQQFGRERHPVRIRRRQCGLAVAKDHIERRA